MKCSLCIKEILINEVKTEAAKQLFNAGTVPMELWPTGGANTGQWWKQIKSFKEVHNMTKTVLIVLMCTSFILNIVLSFKGSERSGKG